VEDVMDPIIAVVVVFAIVIGMFLYAWLLDR
jgi:hypothetical protein